MRLRYRTICCKIFVQIGERVAGDGKCVRVERCAGCRSRVDARGVVHKIRVEALLLNLLRRQIPRELIHDRADHLEVRQFFRTDKGVRRKRGLNRSSLAIKEIFW